MTNVDQFESVFRSAARDVFEYKPVEIRTGLIVTDQDEEGAKTLVEAVRRYLRVLGTDLEWKGLHGDAARSPEELLNEVQKAPPHLVCTYRNLHSGAWKYPYSLGEHLDVLTQHTDLPVLVLPHPDADRASTHALENTNRVVAVTNHLAGDHRLVNHAVRFTEPRGTLTLAHIEDDLDFGRIMAAIEKIPTIDTDDAREKLTRQLLKEPKDYVDTCRKALEAAGVELTVEAVIEFGHRVSDIARRIEERKVDLLVFNTMDEGQLAMHGLAYSLAVEIRNIPVLML